MDQTNGTNMVDIGIDLREFYLSVEWDILEVPAKRNEEYFPEPQKGGGQPSNVMDQSRPYPGNNASTLTTPSTMDTKMIIISTELRVHHFTVV